MAAKPKKLLKFLNKVLPLMSEEKLTPLMAQYFQIRSQYSDSLLLFQVGDFYELFFDDAIVASAFLAITLTKRGKCRGQDIPLCGIPTHALTHYLSKLIRGGFKVALCEQLTQPIPGQVVERGVTQVFTPGTLTDPQMLDNKSPSYLLSIFPYKQRWGMIFGELLTAQLFATSVPAEANKILENELSRFFPDEIVIPNIKDSTILQSHLKQLGYWVSISTYPIHIGLENYDISDTDFAQEALSKAWIENQFNSNICTKIFENPAILHTLQLLYFYLNNTQKQSLSQFKTVQFYEPDDYLILDLSTQKNLEIVNSIQTGTKSNSLFSVVDKAKTPMGSRTIKKWLQRPLVQQKSIIHRQEVVSAFKDSIETLQLLENTLSNLPDIERIVGRIALKRATLQDYHGLKASLSMIPNFRAIILRYINLDFIKIIFDKLNDFSDLLDLLNQSLNDDPDLKIIIKPGFNSELDRMRDLINNAQKSILALEQKEIERTGINSLKIRYNSLSGYSIEITKTNLSLVPQDYMRQQTLSNKERYVTKELLDLEREITKAQNEIASLESLIFESIKSKVDEQLVELRQLAHALSYLDALFGFAKIAYDNNYIAPNFEENSDSILIVDGRHPVVENSRLENFIANSTSLNSSEPVWIITGPNMGGKSTYLRQVGLICILAQCGSLVPAKYASLPILDRIFTRIGSGDNLAEGKSTFLVEMEETALICRQATNKSLVILDEVGRGTSTYDGLAIAQAVVEYIYLHLKAKCLFATHYHELTKLKENFPGIVNYHMACSRTNNGIVFLHKIEKGVSLGSFGLEVAKLAALPGSIISRAGTILTELSNQEKNQIKLNSEKSDNLEIERLISTIETQQTKIEEYEKIISFLESINLEDLSPKKAFDILWQLKR